MTAVKSLPLLNARASPKSPAGALLSGAPGSPGFGQVVQQEMLRVHSQHTLERRSSEADPPRHRWDFVRSHCRRRSDGDLLQNSKASGLLSGVSGSVELLNLHSQHHLDRLTVEADPPMHSTKSGRSGGGLLTRRRSSGALPADVGTDEDFADLLEGTLGSIAALRRSMDNFDPTSSPTSPSGQQHTKARKGNNLNMSPEDFDKLQERMEAYKTARKVEPEPPPIPQKLPPKPSKDPPERDMLLRNASLESLRMSSLESKKVKLQHQMQLEKMRSVLAAANRRKSLDEKAEQIKEKMKQKEQQAVRALAMRQATQPKFERWDFCDRRKEQMVEKWLTKCVVGVFAQRVLEELRMRKMSDYQRLEYISKTQHISRMPGSIAERYAQQAKEQAQRIEDMCHKPSLLRMMTHAAMRAQYLTRLNKTRQHARCITKCLKEWGCAGRTFVALKSFGRRVVMLQHWWRRTSAHLRRVRDAIAHRWERLEREQMIQELHAREHVKDGRGRAAPAPDADVPRRPRRGATRRADEEGADEEGAAHRAEPNRACVRVQPLITSERVRHRFLEHELRARRYKLLPAIQDYQEGMKQFQNALREKVEEREMNQRMGLEDTDISSSPMLAWPPKKPSYLPPPGQKGDEMILDMWRRSRASPGGQSGWMKAEWTSKGSGKGGGVKRSKGTPAAAAKEKDQLELAEQMTFGDHDTMSDMGEEELQEWGCSSDSMLPTPSTMSPPTMLGG